MTTSKQVLTSLRKALGTLKTVNEMAEEWRYCADIANQINATIGLLKSANRELMRSHLACCWKKKFSEGSEKEVTDFIDELVRTWDIATRK